MRTFLLLSLLTVCLASSPRYLHAQERSVVASPQAEAMWTPDPAGPAPVTPPPPAPVTTATPVPVAQTPQAPPADNTQFLQMCVSMLGALAGALGGANSDRNAQNADDIQSALDRQNDEMGYRYEDGIDQDIARDVGSDTTARFSRGCDNFINSRGELGPWGRTAIAEIRNNPDAYENRVPQDIHQWCPRYSAFNADQRQLFWVWVFASMAASESSCDPAANNPNAPNGTAYGLFQLDRVNCGNINLNEPHGNTRCAVRRLARELNCRNQLMTPTSRGRCGTYWGPLRTDDNNTARGGDIRGAQRTRGLIQQYRYCHPQVST